MYWRWLVDLFIIPNYFDSHMLDSRFYGNDTASYNVGITELSCKLDGLLFMITESPSLIMNFSMVTAGIFLYELNPCSFKVASLS